MGKNQLETFKPLNCWIVINSPCVSRLTVLLGVLQTAELTTFKSSDED